ncbi:MAG TPA: TrkA family potassium uptake protein [Verrucomicrobiae bacterium]|nr:TrkA family potassium uptake protein [Verrucomicrobiae bacterium]
MEKQFAVIGLGRFGTSVAETLEKMGYDVLALDVSEERVEEVSSVITHTAIVDSLNERALRSLGIRNFDVVVVAIGQDVQASILTTLNLKELGCKHVVVKAQNSVHGKVLEKIGADHVVFPERDMGVRVAHYLVANNILDYLELSPDYSLLECTAPDQLVGKSLKELNLRAKAGINVVAIKRGTEIHPSPGADKVIQKNDVIIAIGKNTDLQNLEQ